LLRAGQGNDERKGRKGPQRKDAMDAMGMQVTIDFGKDGGLVAGIVQDAASGEVLMLGFLNEESYRKTVETGFVTFWSRTRQKLWMKGETSGNRLRVVSAATDCDNDALLFRVHVEGDGLVCHEGTVSCFTKPILGDTRGEIRETK
jgi:phosphoribosyl-ATP pyrophosphohydrolase/phosphoribosyl-AMP cyclohydrolase